MTLLAHQVWKEEWRGSPGATPKDGVVNGRQIQ